MRVDNFYDWLERGTRDCRLQPLADIVPNYKRYESAPDYVTKQEFVQTLKGFRSRLTEELGPDE